MPIAVFFRPDEDFALQYAKSWLKSGVEEANKRGYTVIDLVDADCTFDKLKDTLENNNVDVAMLAGHGSSTVFTGYQQQVVFQACQGDEIMAGTISHFLSCIVGQELLPSMITKGAVWTIGYQETFDFMVDTSFPIEEDPVAQPFKEITVAIVTAILDGKKLKEAWDIGIAKCDEWIQKLWDRPEVQWAEVISTIQHDRDCMIGLGSEEAYAKTPTILSASVAIPIVIGISILGIGWLIYNYMVTH